jgi:hypothetical protein
MAAEPALRDTVNRVPDTKRVFRACARLLPAILLTAFASALPAAASAGEKGPIQDNSFLIEEAYNQEPGVIQHISAFNRARSGDWGYSFTEEWPVLGQTHQASVTFQLQHLQPSTTGAGDLALNYRLQAVGSGDAPVAFAPRLSLLLPIGEASRGLGSGGVGVQVNLPLSSVLSGRFVTHANLGGTYVPSADAGGGGSTDLAAFNVGQSFIWLAHHNLNFLVEAVYTAQWLGSERTDLIVVNPGVRAAIDFESGLQIVPGVAVPLTLGRGRPDAGIFLYLSFEHPFWLAGPQT